MNKKRSSSADRRGFTLIELLIVIAMLGILATGMTGFIIRTLDAQQRTTETLLAIEAATSQLEYLKALNQAQGLQEGRGQPLPVAPETLFSLPAPTGRVDVQQAPFPGVWEVHLTLQWGDEQRQGNHELHTFLPRIERTNP